MINNIRKDGKIWKRRSKNLTSGEIECKRCGDWTKINKLKESHFCEEFICKNCSKEIKDETPKETKKHVKKEKLTLPENCEFKSQFYCKNPKDCIGCYYHPIKEIALDDGEGGRKSSHLWLWSDKKHAKTMLKLLDDIRKGKGLHKGGNRSYLKHSKREKEDE